MSKSLAGLILIFLAGCSVQPPASDIESAIRRYYDGLGHRVVKVVIGDISSQPIGDMKYMGTKGYTIAIESLKLEIGKDTVGQRMYVKGERVTFEDGIVTIREDPAQKRDDGL